MDVSRAEALIIQRILGVPLLNLRVRKMNTTQLQPQLPKETSQGTRRSFEALGDSKNCRYIRARSAMCGSSWMALWALDFKRLGLTRSDVLNTKKLHIAIKAHLHPHTWQPTHRRIQPSADKKKIINIIACMATCLEPLHTHTICKNALDVTLGLHRTLNSCCADHASWNCHSHWPWAMHYPACPAVAGISGHWHLTGRSKGADHLHKRKDAQCSCRKAG